MDPEQQLQEMAEAALRRQAIEQRLLAENPRMSGVTAVVIAGDLDSAEMWTQKMEREGLSPEDVVWLIGSYARLGWACDHLSESYIVEHLTKLWRDSDPDDTDPRFLLLWQKAKAAKGSYIRDGRPLPRRAWIDVFRGQLPGDPLGIAWTTNPKIAQAFARGRGTRAPMTGAVLRGTVARDRILAFITGRAEDEVVVSTSYVRLRGMTQQKRT